MIEPRRELSLEELESVGGGDGTTKPTPPSPTFHPTVADVVGELTGILVYAALVTGNSN